MGKRALAHKALHPPLLSFMYPPSLPLPFTILRMKSAIWVCLTESADRSGCTCTVHTCLPPTYTHCRPPSWIRHDESLYKVDNIVSRKKIFACTRAPLIAQEFKLHLASFYHINYFRWVRIFFLCLLALYPRCIDCLILDDGSADI